MDIDDLGCYVVPRCSQMVTTFSSMEKSNNPRVQKKKREKRFMKSLIFILSHPVDEYTVPDKGTPLRISFQLTKILSLR